MYQNHVKIEKLRKTIDKVAYASLILDICIAIVTSLSILNIGNPQPFLAPINYMLTLVVVLSIGLFITLFLLKHEEHLLDNLLNRRYKYRPKLNSFLDKIKTKLKKLMHVNDV